MLTRYIQEAMGKARYKMLKDGSYFGGIPGLEGVWADERTLEKCREVLQEVLEEWLILKEILRQAGISSEEWDKA
jgi:predicted RNase H-like HicB family nuclease